MADLMKLIIFCSIFDVCQQKSTALPTKTRLLANLNLPKLSDASDLLTKLLGSPSSPKSNLKDDKVKVPKYMLDLFDAVSDSNGIQRKGMLLAGNIVRSFYNEAKDEQHDKHSVDYFFNVADISQNETIHKAELRLFKLKDRLLQKRGGDHFYQVDIKDRFTDTVIQSKLISCKGFGWETFLLTKEVKSWVANPKSNQGVQVVVKSRLDGKLHIQFAGADRENKEPILVVFSDKISEDKKKGLKSYREEMTNYARQPRNKRGGAYLGYEEPVLKGARYFIDYLDVAGVVNQRYQNSTAWTKAYKKSDPISKSSRTKSARSSRRREKARGMIEDRWESIADRTNTTEKHQELFRRYSLRFLRRAKQYEQERKNNVKCQKVDMIVDVNKISWDKWILQPRIFNAYRCSGQCNVYSSNQRGRQTTHATIQAILSVTDIEGNGNVNMPCCAPKELEPMSLLFYKEVDKTIVVTLQSIEDIVVKSCACL